MTAMTTVSDALQVVGVTDTALTVMGPSVTVVVAWLAGIAAGQLVKFPLAKFTSDEWHGYLTRICGVVATFCFAHYLSNHLSVTLEMGVAVTQPIVYIALQKTTAKYVPWLSNTLLRTVNNGKP